MTNKNQNKAYPTPNESRQHIIHDRQPIGEKGLVPEKSQARKAGTGITFSKPKSYIIPYDCGILFWERDSMPNN